MLRDEIKQAVTAILKDLALPEVEFVVEHPAEEGHGDYSANIAMAMFANSKFEIRNSKFRTPRDLAEAISQKLGSKPYVLDAFANVEAAGPGFINISIKNDWFVSQLDRVLDKGKEFGLSEALQGEKVMVEFTDPNPFKEFHIGHLYSNIVGESLCRLLEASGAVVKRVNYQGDVGMHVAKAIWGLLRTQNAKFKMKSLEKRPLEERVKFLGEAYAAGAKAYEDDPKALSAMKDLNTKIFAKDKEIGPIYEKGRAWSLEYFEHIYQRLGTKFSSYYFEREVGEVGKKLVEANLKKGVFEKSKGAIIFSKEKSGLHTRVFINSLGLPTYEAKELGLALTKYKDFAYDQSIIVTGREIEEYFKVLLSALKIINPELREKTRHLSHGMVRLPEGKMSSRTGNILTGEWLLDEAKKRALKLMKEPENPLPEEEANVVAEQVGQAAVKWALLRQSIGNDIIFDFDESVSFEGNCGPYIQYTYARARSVLHKHEARLRPELRPRGSTKHEKISDFDIRISDFNTEELSVLRWLYRYPEVVEAAGAEFAPHQICNFLYELAGRYNTFYSKHSILGIKSKEPVSNEQREFRLALTAATAQVIKNGLNLLGIQSPERM